MDESDYFTDDRMMWRRRFIVLTEGMHSEYHPPRRNPFEMPVPDEPVCDTAIARFLKN
ncbi:MAG TPA: hypothetical protein V6C89_14980 [Drouetiella sp.]